MAIRAIVLSLAGLILSTSLVPLMGQQDYSTYPLVVTKITSDLIDPPTGLNTTTATYAPSASYGPQARNKKWLRVEFQFQVHPPQSAAFMDEATFKVIIEGRDISTGANGGDGIPVGMTGSVTYVNIYAGNNATGVFYVAPSTLDRYSGPGAGGAGDYVKKFDVHVDAYLNGGKVVGLDKNPETDAQWFTKVKPIAGLVYNKDQSPFVASDTDKYPAIKLRTPSLE